MTDQRVRRKNPTKKRLIAIYRGWSEKPRDGVELGRPWVTEHFLARVDKSGGADECWPWKGARSGFGYGRVKIQGKLLSPHRVAWVIANGDLIPGDSYHGGTVMHSCDNPICCNPAHLSLGTQADNVADMIAKGRSGLQCHATPVPPVHFVGFRGGAA